MFVLQEIFSIFIYKSCLFFVSNLGITTLQISYFYDKLSFYCNKNFLNIKTINNDTTSIKIKNKFLLRITQILINLTKLSKNKLLLFGIGFRSWMYRNLIILKLGFSNDLTIIIPPFIKVVCLKPSLFLLKCSNKAGLNAYIFSLRRLRIPDVYKNKGVLFFNEKVCTKQGKHN